MNFVRGIQHSCNEKNVFPNYKSAQESITNLRSSSITNLRKDYYKSAQVLQIYYKSAQVLQICAQQSAYKISYDFQ